MPDFCPTRIFLPLPLPLRFLRPFPLPALSLSKEPAPFLFPKKQKTKKKAGGCSIRIGANVGNGWVQSTPTTIFCRNGPRGNFLLLSFLVVDTTQNKTGTHVISGEGEGGGGEGEEGNGTIEKYKYLRRCSFKEQ